MITASFRSKNGAIVAMKSAPANVLCVDNRVDLALLKIDNAPPLPAVRLAIGVTVESGERVTIIGNPGSSGAPMFNSNGLAIGLVELKAEIESAGFAVSADDLGTFLVSAVNAAGPGATIGRQWFDASGEHRTDAQYLGFSKGAVQLRRTDGKEISVPLGKLSVHDQAFVRLLQPGATGVSAP